MSNVKARHQEESWAYTAARLIYSQKQEIKPTIFLRVKLINHFDKNNSGIDLFNLDAEWMRLTVYLDNVSRFNSVHELETYLKTSIEAYINNSLMFYDEEAYLGPVDLTTKYTADTIENIVIDEHDDMIYLTAVYSNFGVDGTNGMRVKRKIML